MVGVCATPSTRRSSVSSRSSLPASRSCMIAAAVNVFVIEPMTYCVSGVASTCATVSATPTGVSQMSSPSRRTAAETLGSRCSRCSFRTSCSRRAASRSGASDTDGDHLLDALDCLVDVLVADVEMCDGPQPAWPEVADLDSPLRQPFAQAGLVGNGDEVRLDGRRIDPDSLGKPLRACMIVGESRDVVVERVQHRGRGYSRLAKRAAEEELSLPRALDRLSRAGEDRAERAAEPL